MNRFTFPAKAGLTEAMPISPSNTERASAEARCRLRRGQRPALPLWERGRVRGLSQRGVAGRRQTQRKVDADVIGDVAAAVAG
jgi:hypothetical protein